MTPTPLLTRIKERAEPSKITQLPVVPTWVRRIREGKAEPKVLYNGAWQSSHEGGAA
jgi:hypothetical protein